jgi:PKD repeat protein
LAAKRKYLDVDELYRSKLEDFPVEPGDAVKADLMRKVSVKEFFRFNPARFNIYYLAAAAATVSVALVLTLSGLSSDEERTSEPGMADSTVTEKSPANTEIIPSTAETTATPNVKRDVSTIPSNPSETVSRATKNEVSVSQNPQIIKILPDTVRAQKDVADDSINAEEKTILSSSFAISTTSGCAPLSISLHNTSGNYKTIKWSSGDGRTSVQNSLEWVYNKPGVYTVVLKAIAENGKEETSSEVIVVNPSPKAKFDITGANGDITDREIMVYNYSEGSLTSKWQFGDGETSLMREPLHVYSKSGSYRVLLTVTNEFGCTDTLSTVYATSKGTYRIDFPNAFIPNKNGPTGGNYSPRSDEAASVFHPEYEGVTDYYLVVNSRTGVVMFESRSINIGWDGYYKGQLCDPGVYVWRSRGRFANGEQFIKSGDITILRY